MTSVSLPAGVPHPPAAPPAADPQAIRACLTPTLVAEFDREWEIVLERAKQEKDITAIHSLLNKWRHLAYAELQNPDRTSGCWPRPSRPSTPDRIQARSRSRTCEL